MLIKLVMIYSKPATKVGVSFVLKLSADATLRITNVLGKGSKLEFVADLAEEGKRHIFGDIL